MGDLTKNFSRREFACHGEGCCGHSAPINLFLVEGLQIARDRIASRIVVNRGFSCLTYNRILGSDDTSQHPKGNAADFFSPEYDLVKLYEEILNIPRFALGGVHLYLDRGFIHADVRPDGPARW